MVELNLNEAAAVLDNLITDALIAYTWTETGMAFTGKAQFLTRMSGSILAAEQLRDRLVGLPNEKQVAKAQELAQAYKEEDQASPKLTEFGWDVTTGKHLRIR